MKKLLHISALLAAGTLVSNGQTFSDGFETTLSNDPTTDINEGVPGRQGGSVTGNWTKELNSAGTGTSSENMLLGNSGSQLTSNYILSRTNITSPTRISNAQAHSPNLYSQLAGEAYTVSGEFSAFDAGSTSFSTFANAGGADADTNFEQANIRFGVDDHGPGGLDGIHFDLVTFDASTWEMQVNDNNTTIDTFNMPNFDFGTPLTFTLNIDETGANDSISGTFEYGNEIVTLSATSFNFNDINGQEREISVGGRHFIDDTGTDGPGAGNYDTQLDIQFDNISVVVPEPSNYALGLGVLTLALAARRRRHSA